MILVFGSINIDWVARVPSIPRPGETVLARAYETLFGGKGANQAVAAARASRGAGIAVAIAARVGSDAFGRAAVANLAANGVSAAFVSAVPEPTGCAFVVVEDSGENAITIGSGANSALTAASLGHAFTAADVLVLQMEAPFAESLRTATRARAAGAQVIWNFAPAPAGFGREELLSLLAATDILVVNQHEAVAATRILGTAPESAGRLQAPLLTAGSRRCSRPARAARSPSPRMASAMLRPPWRFDRWTRPEQAIPSWACWRPRSRRAESCLERFSEPVVRRPWPAPRRARRPECRIAPSWKQHAPGDWVSLTLQPARQQSVPTPADVGAAPEASATQLFLQNIRT